MTEAHSQQQKKPSLSATISQRKLRSITLFFGLSNKPSLSTTRRHRCLSSTPPPLREPIAIAAWTIDSHGRSENRSPPPPSWTSLSAIIGQNLLTPNLSHSLFLLRSLSRLCRVCVFGRGFDWVSFELFGFHLICFWVLFDLFVHFVWVCLYFLFVFSFVGLYCKWCVWWNASMGWPYNW